MSYVIQHGIPLPPSAKAHSNHRGSRGQFSSRLSMVLDAMPVGSSFLLRTKEESKSATSRFRLFAPKRFTVRKLPGEGWRVWRVE